MIHDIDDEELLNAARIVIEAREANSSLLQRKLGVGYGKACKLLDGLEEAGIITEERAVKMRQLIARSPEEAAHLIAIRNSIE